MRQRFYDLHIWIGIGRDAHSPSQRPGGKHANPTQKGPAQIRDGNFLLCGDHSSELLYSYSFGKHLYTCFFLLLCHSLYFNHRVLCGCFSAFIIACWNGRMWAGGTVNYSTLFTVETLLFVFCVRSDVLFYYSQISAVVFPAVVFSFIFAHWGPKMFLNVESSEPKWGFTHRLTFRT